MIWKILIFLGTIPFLVPVLLGVYRMQIESWTMTDWLILYSFIYWPTYIVGVVLIALGAVKLIIGRKSDEKQANRIVGNRWNRYMREENKNEYTRKE